MSAYLSSLIGNLSTDARAYVPALALPEAPKCIPHIATVAMFNPSWVAETEDFELLRRQILFFDSDIADASDCVGPETAALNIVGLLRGTQALAAELGGAEQTASEPQNSPPQPLVVLLAGGAFVVCEIEPGYYLACFAAIPETHSARHEAMMTQVQTAVAAAHAAFTVLHPPVTRLEALLGRAGVSACFERHWLLWRRAYNKAAHYGPNELAWPNRLNPRGFLGMLPDFPFQRLAVRVSEALEAAVGEVVTEGKETAPLGMLVFHTDVSVPKRAGLVYLEMKGLLLAALGATCHLVELFLAHGLDPEILRRREPLVEIYTRMAEATSSERSITSDESDAQDRTPEPEIQALAASLEALHGAQGDLLSPLSSMAHFLHPATITDALVVLPLNYSFSGIKSLGLAVNEQISGVLWWSSAPTQAEPAEQETEEPNRCGRFLSGLADGLTGPLLLYLSHSQHCTTEEYLLVLYQEADTLLAFIYDSGLEQLGRAEFYSRLHHNTCEPIVDMTLECVNGGTTLGGSIGSLPIAGPEITIAPDTDFFYVVYDCKEKSYQSSLPPLMHKLPLEGLQNALFHLHDQLVDHFLVKSTGSMFHDTSDVEEHLHKFCSNKSNDWLFYLIHHKHKRIVVIRNYNKNKTKVEPKIDETYLRVLADSVYDYAHLGFLDSLGDDVKVWLEGLTRSEG